MNRNRTDQYIPAELKSAQDLPALWGRLAFLSPRDAELISHFEYPEGRTLLLSFELGRAAFADVRAKIKKAARDSDGYYNYVLVFLDPAQSALLRAAIAQASPGGPV